MARAVWHGFAVGRCAPRNALSIPTAGRTKILSVFCYRKAATKSSSPCKQGEPRRCRVCRSIDAVRYIAFSLFPSAAPRLPPCPLAVSRSCCGIRLALADGSGLPFSLHPPLAALESQTPQREPRALPRRTQICRRRHCAAVTPAAGGRPSSVTVRAAPHRATFPKGKAMCSAQSTGFAAVRSAAVTPAAIRSDLPQGALTPASQFRKTKILLRR